MKTRLDVVTRALRHAGIVAHDEVPGADAAANAGDVLDTLLAEANVGVSSASVPDVSFVALANWLAAEIGPTFAQSDARRAREKLRFMATIVTDDRVPSDPVQF